MRKALIDGDWLAYASAFSIESTNYEVLSKGSSYSTSKAANYQAYIKNNKLKKGDYELLRTRNTSDVEYAYRSVEDRLSAILTATGAEDSRVCLSGRDNFRQHVEPTYKANREDSDKPIHLDDVTTYMCESIGAFYIPYMEADDYLGIAQYADWEKCSSPEECTTVVVTIDKDLDTIPGHHYNPVTGEAYYLTSEEADYNFWRQMLIGDRADNIKGVVGLGPKKSDKILRNSPDARMAVLNQYELAFADDADVMFTTNYSLLRILRTTRECPLITMDKLADVERTLRDYT